MADEKKTMADVADKAVSEIADGVERVAEAFERLAPEAWDVMVRQQVTEAIIDLVGLAVFLVAFGLAWIMTRGLRAEHKVVTEGINLRHRKELTDAARIAWCITASITFVMLCIAVGVGTGAAARLANPEYYAAKELLEVLK